ncbi:rhamnogalacturonan lyase [Filimonas effusa]|uniref:Rhamnogalacturonan lyase n=1 Tax=Filimonas effusa TaxID=2508721 RepID=A0A4Q1DAI4_9BACT|nr:rhamnogalacturonan lyase [Filimonas effusa]RXK85775.1 rhamnogalacturonan lyase [Filimonas effusa]
MKKKCLLGIQLLLAILSCDLRAQQQAAILKTVAPEKAVTMQFDKKAAGTPIQMERLNRGLVAVRTGPDSVYLSWRLFGNDVAGMAFNIYRDGVKINNAPVTGATNYIDPTSLNGNYSLRPIINGHEHGEEKPVSVWPQNYLDIPLDKPAGGVTPDGVTYTYTANDCSVGDLDGDGEYEIILKWDPTNAKDNSQRGYTGAVYLDAYKFNGTRLWRINLGPNIRAGAHYTQFMVYDLDGDGKAELACKTADGTVDGAGKVIGDAGADYRNKSGYIISGPEFLTVFNGLTGVAMATVPYLPARGSADAWGDAYGNRVDRFIAAVAYLDGARPSLIMGRGYYTRLVRAAWDWREGKLRLRWIFDSDSTGNDAYRGDGNHQMTVGDVDGDGRQEVINGSSAIDDNGKGLWTNEMGHGDALHMSDMDPERPGLEIWQSYEGPRGNGGVGAALVDARTGNRIFTMPEPKIDVGRALAADIDPRYKGYEMWAAVGNLYTAKGVEIGAAKPSMNFAIWWDGDLLRELLDGTTVYKWDYENSRQVPLLETTGTASNNWTKKTPALSADILGDWREEVIFRTSDNQHLRIYTTTIPTQHRIYTLMHDPQYRVAIAWQNAAYNQPPHPGFYLGMDMGPIPVPNITYAGVQK